MNVEKMIYAYLIICTGMIIFNIVSAMISRSEDKKMIRVSSGFREDIFKELTNIEKGGTVSDQHMNYLIKRLKKIGNMVAFDEALEEVYKEKPAVVREYLLGIEKVFTTLVRNYAKKDETEITYVAYIITKYGIVSENPVSAIIEILFDLLHESSIYCREKAMQALYTTGNSQFVLKALRIIDKEHMFYHGKLITDGLLDFKGDRKELSDLLWENFESFSINMKLNFLNYFRFSCDEHAEQMLRLMDDTSQDDEIRFSCIRYFGKYYHEEAYESLIKYADGRSPLRWEFSAISSTALALYKTEKTIELLKANLYNYNWYIRFNSSQSLEKMGIGYLDLIDVLEGKDRYASEILRYRFDIRGIGERKKEATGI